VRAVTQQQRHQWRNDTGEIIGPETGEQPSLHTSKRTSVPRFEMREKQFDQDLGFPAGLPDFFFVQHTKTGENIPNNPKISQMATRYTRRL
jgi:hypothetical protein